MSINGKMAVRHDLPLELPGVNERPTSCDSAPSVVAPPVVGFWHLSLRGVYDPGPRHSMKHQLVDGTVSYYM